MNKIQKIQKFFNTDKWWGKTIFIFLVYLLFWCIFYGVWLLIESSFGEYEYYIYRTPLFIGSIFLFIILPIITFFIFPKFLKKITNIKHPYFINSIAIFLSLFIFIFFEILIAIKHFFSRGFL